MDQSADEKIRQAAAVDAHNVGRYRVRQITVGQLPVVVVEVSRREDGFAQTSDGRILVRRGPRNQPLIGDDVWGLASSRTLRRFERSPAGVRRDQVEVGEFVRVTLPIKGPITPQERARKVTGLDLEEARAALKRLRDQGFLTQHGQRGGAYYLLNRH